MSILLKDMRETTIELIDIWKHMPYYLFDKDGKFVSLVKKKYLLEHIIRSNIVELSKYGVYIEWRVL